MIYLQDKLFVVGRSSTCLFCSCGPITPCACLGTLTWNTAVCFHQRVSNICGFPFVSIFKK